MLRYIRTSTLYTYRILYTKFLQFSFCRIPRVFFSFPFDDLLNVLFKTINGYDEFCEWVVMITVIAVMDQCG